MAAGFFAAAFLAAGFAAFLAAGAAFFAAGFAAFFAAGFFAAAFFAAGAAFFAAGFAAFFAAGFFTSLTGAFLGAGAFFGAAGLGSAAGGSSARGSAVARAWLRHARSVCARRAAVASDSSGHACWMCSVSAALDGAVSASRSGARRVTTSSALIAILSCSRSSAVPRPVAASARPLSETESPSPAARNPRLLAAWIA